MKNTRDELIKIAYENPELRADLLRIITADRVEGTKPLFNKKTEDGGKKEPSGSWKEMVFEGQILKLWDDYTSFLTDLDHFTRTLFKHAEAWSARSESHPEEVSTEESKSMRRNWDLIEKSYRELTEYKKSIPVRISAEDTKGALIRTAEDKFMPKTEAHNKIREFLKRADVLKNRIDAFLNSSTSRQTVEPRHKMHGLLTNAQRFLTKEILVYYITRLTALASSIYTDPRASK